MDYEKTFAISYNRVLSTTIDGVCFIEAFYNRFISSSDDVAEKFKNTNMANQHEMLRKSISHMMNCYINRSIDKDLVHIAVRHNRENLDIRPELYDIWLECLIDTARLYDSEFDKYAELSWRIILSMGITYMKFRHKNLLRKFL